MTRDSTISRDGYWDYARSVVPAQATSIVFYCVTLALTSVGVGVALGHPRYGWMGGVIGAIVGLGCGVSAALLLYRATNLWPAWRIGKKSDEGLREVIAESGWGFYHNLALYQLALRGQDIEFVRPRILDLLASDSEVMRLMTTDALQLFPDLRRELGDYSPWAPTERCRSKIEALRKSNEP